ncbi:hypothetical protein D3C77_597880 [compost metagenome]
MQFLDHVAFLDQVVIDLYPRDFTERLGQRLGFVLVRGDGFRHDVDFIDALGLQLGRGVHEPLHLGHLLVLGQRGRLELGIHPLLRLRLAGPSP